MKTKDKIEHAGVVSRITDNSLVINMIVNSACTTCDAKGACGVGESEIKEVEVPIAGNSLKPGDEVVVRLDQSMGILAMLIGYIFPFILMILVLIVAEQLTGSEGLSGLLAIGILIPYYLILYFFRNKLKQKFKFSLKQ